MVRSDLIGKKLPIQLSQSDSRLRQSGAPPELVMISTPQGIAPQDLPSQDYVYDVNAGKGVMVYILVGSTAPELVPVELPFSHRIHAKDTCFPAGLWQPSWDRGKLQVSP